MGKISLPPMSCFIHNCHACVKAKKSYIMLKDFSLLEPETFILRHIDEPSGDIPSTSYQCVTEHRTPCDCELTENCSGDASYCNLRNCSTNSNCYCSLTYLKPLLLAVTPSVTVSNPTILSLDVCLYDKKNSLLKPVLHRKLLEKETAIFTQYNMSLKFNDPILTLPDRGRVIIRSETFEHVLTVPQDLMITLPFEILAYKTDIQVIYIHDTGRTITGIIHVTGKSRCQLRQCILCLELFRNIKCYPPIIQYIFYAIIIFITLLLLLCIRLFLKSIIFIFYCFMNIFYLLYKLAKLLARCSLLIGAFFGSAIRDIVLNTYHGLELYAVNRANIASLPLVLLLCCSIFTTTYADCNTHAIIQTDLKKCDILQDGSKVCKMYTTSEFSLKTLSSESCLWFSDRNNVHLFSLTVKLESVSCLFHTERVYFTFPVKAKHISQVSCIYNKYCGQGVHCMKRKVGKEGTHFEAETPESRSFPGLSTCLPGGLGVGCTILTRASCNFFRSWYEPDLLHSYEVSKIHGHSCSYHISLTHNENNTISRVTVSDSAFTNTGIKVTVVGAFDQPQLHLTDYFIQRVGRPNEAYLAPASHKNSPKAGEIGSVQANTSYTTDFIFDPQLTTCDFFEDSLRCVPAPDALHRMRTSQEYSLPLQRDIHLFQIKDGQLQSTLLLSSAVRIQLHFTDYKVSVQSVTICPQFKDTEIKTSGCYNCPILARMTINAHSTCEPGVVRIIFQEINIHTKAIRLNTEPSDFIIQFAAGKQCFSEKICLQSPTIVQCKTISFCLNEPTIELRQLDTNYTHISSVHSSANLFDWITMPNLSSPIYFLKIVGSALFIICLVITILSTLITCCRTK